MKKILCIVIICLIFLIGLYVFTSYYKIEDRIEDLKKYKIDISDEPPIGWIRVQGTDIDFPIFYHDDVEEISNPKYELGWSFEDNRKLVNRTVLLSHNVLNVSNKPLIRNKNHKRFEQLMAYIYYDFVKENKYIQYTINNKNYLFKIYGVSFQKEDEVLLGNLDDLEIDDYVKETMKNSYFDFNVDVKKNDQLLTLVTCTRFFGNADYSFVIDARRVRKKELIKNYGVKKNKNYDKIEKIMEGAEKNE